MARKVAYYGIFTALAIILSYLERIIPVPIPIPGIKLGLANLVVLLFLYYSGEKEAFAVSIIRIIIVGMLFSGVSGVIYSISGGILSLFVMIIAKRLKVFSIIGVSILGGVFHNLGQIIMASFIINNSKLFYYLPYLIISGEITGVLIGLSSHYVLLHLKHVKIV